MSDFFTDTDLIGPPTNDPAVFSFGSGDLLDTPLDNSAAYGLQSLLIRQIRRDGGTQARIGLNEETVQEYAELMRDHLWDFGSRQRPIVLFDGAAFWLADGFHRIEAAQRAQLSDFPVEVLRGTQRDAILRAAGANSQHGLRRSNADKRRAVELLLRDDEWRQWSDSEIARRCNVSHPTVATVRREIYPENLQDSRTVERNGTTYQQKPPARPAEPTTTEPLPDELKARAKKVGLNVWINTLSGGGYQTGEDTGATNYQTYTSLEALTAFITSREGGPFWQSIDAHHPTAHLWTRERPDLWRSACGIVTQNRAPSGSTEAGHCSSCVRAQWPQNQTTPAEPNTSTDRQIPADLAGWHWLSGTPSIWQLSNGDYETVVHHHPHHAIVEARNYLENQQPPPAAADLNDILKRLDAHGYAKSSTRQKGITTFYSFRDYRSTLEDGQAGEVELAEGELPLWLAELDSNAAYAQAKQEKYLDAQARFDRLGWRLERDGTAFVLYQPGGKHHGTTQQIDPMIKVLDVEERNAAKQAAAEPALTIEQLDDCLPKGYERLGYFWVTATPPTLGHIDGWRGDAPTIAGAISQAADREKASARPPASGDQAARLTAAIDLMESILGESVRGAAVVLLGALAKAMKDVRAEDLEGLSQAISDLNECQEGTEAQHWLTVGYALLDLEKD